MPEGWAVWLWSRQGCEGDHRAAAAGAAIEWERGDRRLGGRRRRVGRGNVEQLAAQCELLGAMAVGEEAVMADAMEAVRQGVQQKAADELVRVEGQDLRLAVVAIILPAEGDLCVGKRANFISTDAQLADFFYSVGDMPRHQLFIGGKAIKA